MGKMKCLFQWNKVIRDFRAEEHFVMSGKKFQYCLQRSVEPMPMERTNTFLPGTLPSNDRGREII